MPPVNNRTHKTSVGSLRRDGLKNKVRDLRDEHNLTQGELAKLLRVSRQWLIRVETEQCDPSLVLALKIAKIFRQPVEEIFEA